MCQQKVHYDLTVLLFRTDTINSAGIYRCLSSLLHQVPDQSEREEAGSTTIPVVSLCVVSFRCVPVRAGTTKNIYIFKYTCCSSGFKLSFVRWMLLKQLIITKTRRTLPRFFIMKLFRKKFAVGVFIFLSLPSAGVCTDIIDTSKYAIKCKISWPSKG